LAELAWWAETLQNDLTQGDIVSAFPIALLPKPLKYLKKMSTLGQGKTGWLEVSDPFLDENDQTYYLAKGRVIQGIIVSHSCDIDKNARRILVAPIAKIESLQENHREAVVNQTNIRLMALPNVPGLGDAYADLRSITAVPAELIHELKRNASMTDQALLLLQTRLIEFFTRKQP